MDILKYMLFAWVLFPASLMAQGDIYSIFSKSYQLENDGQYAEAAAVLESSRQNSYAVNLRLGWLYYQAGQYTVSLGYYSKAISLKPASVEARLGYVLPAAKLKAWSSVGAQYDAILKLDPNNYKANYYRGLMFYNMGNYKVAASYFDRMCNLYPFDYDVVILSAWNSYYMKNKEKAKLLFNQALLIQPNSASAAEGLSLTK